MGYHIKKIKKGTLGEISKIREELEELEDAMIQQNKILMLCELSDIVGAIKHFLNNKFPEFSFEDLMTMSDATESAFKDGTRKCS